MNFETVPGSTSCFTPWVNWFRCLTHFTRSFFASPVRGRCAENVALAASVSGKISCKIVINGGVGILRIMAEPSGTKRTNCVLMPASKAANATNSARHGEVIASSRASRSAPQHLARSDLQSELAYPSNVCPWFQTWQARPLRLQGHLRLSIANASTCF